MRISNVDSWNSDYAVQSYRTANHLQKPEQTIFQILENRLPSMRMLDIGIGTGRTTLHFAPRVREYVGIDYAENMLRACIERFPQAKESFQLGDVRSMPQFEPACFDLILFSYNGIDYINHEDRLRALGEIRRVGKAGGYFVFSTHNLQHIGQLYTIRRQKKWKDFIYQFYSLFMLVALNGLPVKYRTRPYAILNDGTNRFSLLTYYIDPLAQIRQLETAGFKNIRLFSIQTGTEIAPARIQDAKNDLWIYFLCEM